MLKILHLFVRPTVSLALAFNTDKPRLHAGKLENLASGSPLRSAPQVRAEEWKEDWGGGRASRPRGWALIISCCCGGSKRTAKSVSAGHRILSGGMLL